MSETKPEEIITEKVPKTLDELLGRVAGYLPPEDLEILKRAYSFAEKAHEGQIRRSGEPYILHPLGVASILADLKMDLTTVVTGLLHDTVEDTSVTLKDVETQFGPDIAYLVDGVTKISQIQFRHTHEKQGENIRKMILAMGKDIRVVLVKLADRLHNMRTLNHMPFMKQAVIAQETLDIYAPLANRLGISSIKTELEDLSFRYLKPEQFYGLVQKVAKKKKEREKYIEEVRHQLTEEMKRHKINCEIQGRPKHLYSIYKKMEARSLDYDQIYDVLAFRLIVDSVAHCYEVLGVVHSLWKPIPGRFKDFIAMPKANNYQSLHTTVVGPQAERIEIQIRTSEMHLIAERGIAAHWGYKEKREVDVVTQQKIHWLRDLVASYQQMKDPDEFLESIKTDLFESEIYVFTPRGEVKEFPEGATPLDFAYSIHTDVGNKTVAAKVNGKIVPLKHKLRNGDTIEILTSPHQRPSKDWLKFCVTTRAQSKIRAFVRAEERKRAIEVGKEMCERELRRYGLSAAKFLQGPEFEKFLKNGGYPTSEELFVAVGYGKLAVAQIVKSLSPEAKIEEKAEEPKTFLQKVFQNAINKTKKSGSVIQVDGMSDMLVRFGKCCSPIPGDPIIGYISRGRGVTVHSASCTKVFESDKDRRIDVEWTKAGDSAHVVKIRVMGNDATGLLQTLSGVFTAQGVNIHSADVRSTRDKKAICHFEVEVRNTQQLSKLIQELLKIKGIISVERM